jgi:hypothetical protein
MTVHGIDITAFYGTPTRFACVHTINVDGKYAATWCDSQFAAETMQSDAEANSGHKAYVIQAEYRVIA